MRYLQQAKPAADATFCKRLRVLLLLILTAFGLLLARAWQLQVVRGDHYLRLSEGNRLRSLRVKSLRGKILDRTGHVLADNRAAYTLLAIPEDLPPLSQLLPKLQALNLEIDPAALAAQAQPGSFRPIPLQRDLPRDRVAYFAEHRMDYPGLLLEVEPLRFYPYGPLAAHLLGYLGEISEEQLRQWHTYPYQPGDLVGQYGLERTYESVLRGQYGLRQVEVDAFGRETRVIAEYPPQPGTNLVLSLDLPLQQLAEHLLSGQTGAIVALDPRSGQILALASSPAFDPNRFAGRLSAREWQALRHHPEHPLHNRALQGQYPPGSIFKIVAAIAALEERLITPDTSLYCPGFYTYGQRTYRDWKPGGHGHVTLRQALAQSCDVYFYHLGQQLGVDRLARYAQALGLGQPTGFAEALEKPGLIPSKRWKQEVRGEPWYGGETLSVAIGQGYTLTTPLQVATLLATVANGGTLYRPYVVLRQERMDGTVVQTTAPQVLRRLPLRPETLAHVQEGLWDAVNDPKGTGKAARHEQIGIAGKTGTAQVIRLPRHNDQERQAQLPRRYRDHAWFAAFAPYHDPRIVVVVFIEHAGKGGAHFASYATAMIQAYLQPYSVAAELVTLSETGQDTVR